MARGLTNRIPGDHFTDGISNEPIYEFVRVSDIVDSYVPENASFGMNTPILFDTKYITSHFNKAYYKYFVWMKRISDGKDVIFVRFTHKKDMRTRPNKEFGFYAYKATATDKISVGLSPSDFKLTVKNKSYHVADLVNELLDTIEKRADLSDKLKGLLRCMVVDCVVEKHDSTREYYLNGITQGEKKAVLHFFTEILHPITVAVYNDEYRAGDIHNDILIKFPSSKTNGLSDSQVILPDKTLNLSSKYGSPNKSASAGLNMIPLKSSSTPENIISIIKKYHSQYAPFVILHDVYSEITKEMFNICHTIFTTCLTNKTIFESTNMKEDEFLIDYCHCKVDKYYYNITPRGEYNHYYRLVSGMARRVVELVDSTDEFSDFMIDTLSNMNFHQVYTRTKEKNGKLIVEPNWYVAPNSKTDRIVLDANTRYRTNGITGKFGFTIKPI